MTNGRESLESAFASAPTERSKGLAGLLGPRSTAAAKPADSADTKPARDTPRPRQTSAETQAPSPARKAGEGPAAPARKRAGRKPTAKATNDHEHLNVGFYLAPDLLQGIQDHKNKHKMTYGEIMLAAFEAVSIDKLSEYFKPQVAVSASGMPLAPVVRKPEPGVMRQFRLTQAQQQWIEQMVERAGAPSRNQLGIAALRIYLNTHSNDN